MPDTRSAPALTSLYRLCLRASSAAVLHHSSATRHLRRRLRTSFDAAAAVSHRLESSKDVEEQTRLKEWLGLWNKRMDGTFALLYNSATSRGLPHKLTRNLTLLAHAGERKRKFLRSWKPQGQYALEGRKINLRKAQHEDREKRLSECAQEMLLQVVRLAESRADLSLGRPPIRP